ncbi:MAG: YjfB family protein [Vicinamibacterales bacterium]
MSISAVSGSSPSPVATDTERQVAVMKKTKDVEQQTAESLIELVKQAPTSTPGRIDTYA